MSFVIAIDFDGTIVEHMYPHIGKNVPYAFDTIRTLQDRGHKVILWTMRSGDELFSAVDHCARNHVTFWGVNKNPEQDWSLSPKAYAHIYIDDAALGIPLICPDHGRRYVDWLEVANLLHQQGVI